MTIKSRPLWARELKPSIGQYTGLKDKVAPPVGA